MMASGRGLLFGLVFGGAVALYAILWFDGAEARYRLWYYTPAAMLAGSLLADRFGDRRSWNPRNSWTISGAFDLLVVCACACRPLLAWPAMSGHAVFFVYGLITASSTTTRAFAIILGLVTLYAKIWLWHWDATVWPGLVVGIAAGCSHRIMQSKYGRSGR